jgi:hypothetical protein
LLLTSCVLLCWYSHCEIFLASNQDPYWKLYRRVLLILCNLIYWSVQWQIMLTPRLLQSGNLQIPILLHLVYRVTWFYTDIHYYYFLHSHVHIVFSTLRYPSTQKLINKTDVKMLILCLIVCILIFLSKDHHQVVLMDKYCTRFMVVTHNNGVWNGWLDLLIALLQLLVMTINYNNSQ